MYDTNFTSLDGGIVAIYIITSVVIVTSFSSGSKR